MIVAMLFPPFISAVEPIVLPVPVLAPPPKRPRRLRNPWSHGRAYVVIALLAPLVLGSLGILYLHSTLMVWFAQGRLWLRCERPQQSR